MKKQLFSFLIILTFVFSVSAQKTKQSKTEKNLRTHVSYLASDKLEGRRTGENGATQAAGYVMNMFARYKLDAGFVETVEGKTKKNYLQPFEYIAGVELGDNNSLSMGNMKMSVKTEWMPVGYTPDGNISDSKIVFAGFGIASERLKYNDYEGLDVQNKIALILSGNPDKSNPHSQFGLINLHAKANMAKEKGAQALVIIADNEKFDSENLAQLSFNQTLGQLTLPTIVVSRQAAAKMLKTDEKGLKEIEKWMAMRMETPESIQIKFAKDFDAKVNLNVELNKKQAEAYNVIGVIEGRDPQLKNEAIIIGAHYDHLGRGGEGSLAPNSNEIHNGADDNASGTSALLELARQFRKEKKNKRTLIFIAFGAEESGLIGSKAYTNNPVFPLENTVAMINMDMVGRLTQEKLNIGGIGTADIWDNLVKSKNAGQLEDKTSSLKSAPQAVNAMVGSVGTTSSVKIAQPVFNLQLNQDGFGPSDHSSFYAKKIPVLFFFTGTHADYHKPSDDADKINYEGLEKITVFVSDIVKTVDQNPARPAYQVAKSSSPMGGRTRFNVSLGTIPSYADSDNTGLVLDGVRTGSAAEKAGIKSGDKIVKIGDKEVRNISDYMFMLGEMKAGETYDIVVMRDGQKVMLKIEPDARK
jgi:hypothetical protein